MKKLKNENANKYRKEAADRILAVAIKKKDTNSAVQCVDLLRRNGDYKKALKLIEKIRKSNNKMLDKVLTFEKELIIKQDKEVHFLDEVYQEKH